MAHANLQHIPPGPDPWDPRKWTCRHCGDTLHVATDAHPEDGNLYDSAGDAWCVAVSEGTDSRLPHERDTSHDGHNAEPCQPDTLSPTRAVAWFQRLPLASQEAVRAVAERMEDPDPDMPGPMTAEVHGNPVYGLWDVYAEDGTQVGMVIRDLDDYRVWDALGELRGILTPMAAHTDRYDCEAADGTMLNTGCTLDVAVSCVLNYEPEGE